MTVAIQTSVSPSLNISNLLANVRKRLGTNDSTPEVKLSKEILCFLCQSEDGQTRRTLFTFKWPLYFLRGHIRFKMQDKK